MFAPKLTFLLLSCCLFLSCAQEQLAEDASAAKDVATAAETIINLQVNEVRKLDDLSLEFLEVTGDSRCAKDVQCAWQGNLQLVLLVSSGDSAQTVTLNTHGGEKYPNTVNANGHDIKLLKVKPYPATNIRIDPSQYVAQLQLMTSDEMVKSPVFIDVRTTEEYQAGHYPNAVNLNYENIEQTIASLNLPKDTEIIVYCRSGRRSGLAKTMLDSLGYSNVTNGINQSSLHKQFGTTPKM